MIERFGSLPGAAESQTFEDGTWTRYVNGAVGWLVGSTLTLYSGTLQPVVNGESNEGIPAGGSPIIL